MLEYGGRRLEGFSIQELKFACLNIGQVLELLKRQQAGSRAHAFQSYPLVLHFEIETYPGFLDLKDRPVLVVGAGKVALRKTRGLLEAGARVTVIAPDWESDFETLPVRRRDIVGLSDAAQWSSLPLDSAASLQVY